MIEDKARDVDLAAVKIEGPTPHVGNLHTAPLPRLVTSAILPSVIFYEGSTQ